MKELVQARLMAQTPFSVASSSSGRAYTVSNTDNVINYFHQRLPSYCKKCTAFNAWQ